MESNHAIHLKMRPSWFFGLATAFFLATNIPHALAHQDALARRQDPSSSPSAKPEATTPPPEKPTSSSSDDPERATSDVSSQSSSETSSAVSTSSGTSSASDATSTASQFTSDGIVHGPAATPFSNSSSLTNITNIPHIEGLPIQPVLTPALAVAGAILILTGIVYTLVGIKTKWLHILISTTYLFGICVVILIVYVMHPPISNAIQGAYFVAALMTGLIFGAIAVVFQDVTEGLGCFLGGFCLGMWFLVLKPGGLITSQAGKSIFIGCFTVAAFALYISHYTRPYALIGSTSFAGATAVLMGVDMFGRAGLKEFWLYIWDLNSGVFPFNYQGPYPITRGMRVEIACIILLCIFGVMSQMKVWNIVKERRAKKAAEQKRRDELRDQAEEELGRRIEEDNDRDRAVWDAVYGKNGKGSQTDSGFDTSQSSTRKGSMSVVSENEAGGIQMQHLASASSSVKRDIITVHVGQDDFVPSPAPTDTKSIRSKAATSRDPSIHESQVGPSKPGGSETASIKTVKTIKAKEKKPTIDPNLTLKPKFVPLPFKIPGQNVEKDNNEQDDEDKSSVATFAASDRGLERSSSLTKKLGGTTLMRKLSGRSKRSSYIPTTSEEALVIPHDDSDRASSVAVALDGMSMRSLSRENLASGPQTPTFSESKSGSTGYATPQSLPSPRIEQTGFDSDGQHLASNSKSPIVSHFNESEFSPPPPPEAKMAPKRASLVTASSEAEPQAVRAGLAGQLPENASKVVMAYRTNEWAKHLDSAEAPPVEDIKVRKPEKAAANETAAPVNVRDLQQTALTAEPAPAALPQSNSQDDKSQPPSPKESKNPYRKRSSPRISPSASHTNLSKTLPQSPSQTSLASTHSNEGARPPMPRTRVSSSSMNRGLRSSSSPMISSPLAEPIAEDVESSFPSRFTPSPMHLMSQRESVIQSKPSSTSLLNNRSSNTLSQAYSTNNSSFALAHDDDDDIPLAQRKSILQQSPATLLPPQRTLSQSSLQSPYLSAASPSPSANNLPSPSRNPSRLSLANVRPGSTSTNNLGQRDSTVSAWRSSLANDAAHHQVKENAELEARRGEMMAEKAMARNSAAVERMQEQARKSVIDKEMMRRGSGMIDAHREAMRKMQGSVKL